VRHDPRTEFRFFLRHASCHIDCGMSQKPRSPPVGSTTDPDPHWVVQQKPQAKVALVYVHGIIGDMIGTWTAPNGKTFFDLVNENASTKGKADAFVFGFPSYILKAGSFDIREAANRLHERLESSGILSYPAVVFVAHSMGGLVVLRELMTHREVLEKVPVAVFYATPQEGSQITLIAQQLSPDSALAQMTPAQGNDLLKTLSDEWNSISPDKRPHVRCAYEKLATGPTIIVPWSSATRFCEGSPAAIEANHVGIVKPDRPEADSIIVLVNALNEYVLNKELEAKLETPDFIAEGSNEVFLISDSLGKSTARLVNSGGTSVKFTLAEVSPYLYVWPDDTPRDLGAHATANLGFLPKSGSHDKEYRLILRTPIAPDQNVIVRIANQAALDADRNELTSSVLRQISTVLSQPSEVQHSQTSPDNAGQSDAIVATVREEVARKIPNAPASVQWVYSADLLASLNWPSLSVRALTKAEAESRSVVQMPSVQALAGVVSAQSGQTQIFANSKTPIVNPEAVRLSYDSFSAVNGANAALASNLATQMQHVPALKALGLSLQGDVQRAQGDFAAASVAYDASAAIRPTPSVTHRQEISDLERQKAVVQPANPIDDQRRKLFPR
jgi:pimeloyl-ACP methyl ester carboxylesterase